MAAANITGSGGIKNARYIRDMDTRGIRDVPAGKNDDQASINPRAKLGHHDLVKSRPGSRGGGRGGSGCDVGVATPAIGATSTETEIQSETVTAIGSATVTGSATTVSPMTNFPGQGFADGKIAVSYAPRHPPSTSLKTRITQPADGYGSNLNVDRTPVTTSLATAPDSFASAASTSGNRISTSLAISIGLATVAGLALIFAGLLFFKVCRRLRRSGRLDSDLPLDEPKRNTRKSKAAISAPSVSIPLETLPPSLSCPPASPALPTLQVNRSFRTTATFAAPAHVVRPSGEPPGLKLKDVQGGGGPWWKSCGGLEHETAGVGIGMDEVKALGQRRSNPPPLLMDRKFHSSINESTSSIASLKLTLPSKKLTSPTLSHQRGGHVRGRHTPLATGDLNSHWQVSVLPVSDVQPPRRSVRPGATMSSSSPIQFTTHELDKLASPPRTPRQITMPGPAMGRETPRAPRHRALPSPPLNGCQINSSLSSKSHVNTLYPKDIGAAVSGPSNIGITIDKPYYQVWCDASRWRPPQSSSPGEQNFF
ncbi:hypothetical protein E4U17_006985 [Claviceps sp. LM77 group G4]|nr:hypothetical protein E4U17_006985 [Claviceps sp. LM77 group G4]